MKCHLAKPSPTGYDKTPSTPLVLQVFSIPETSPEAQPEHQCRDALECMYAAFKCNMDLTATQAVALEIAFRALRVKP